MLKFKCIRPAWIHCAKSSSASDKAAHIVAMQVRKDTSPYVPALTGSLAKRTRVDGAKSSIRAHTPDICILGS